MISYDDIKPVVDRLFQRKASVEDLLTYLKFEMQEAMKALPLEVKDSESDGFHAGCCCLRALSVVFSLERMLKLPAPAAPPQEREG